jgi:hypothetical protein
MGGGRDGRRAAASTGAGEPTDAPPQPAVPMPSAYRARGWVSTLGLFVLAVVAVTAGIMQFGKVRQGLHAYRAIGPVAPAATCSLHIGLTLGHRKESMTRTSVEETCTGKPYAGEQVSQQKGLMLNRCDVCARGTAQTNRGGLSPSQSWRRA